MILKSFKQVPQPIRWLLHPMGLLSLAAHGMLIFFPGSPPENDAQEVVDSTAIQITAMSEIPHLQDSPPVAPPSPAAPEPPQMEPPQMEPPVEAPAEAQFPPEEPPPAEAPSPGETLPAPAPTPPPTAALPPPASDPLPFADFPHLSGAATGCFGLNNCHQVEGGNFRQVATDLMDQLTAQGYEVRSRDDLEDSGIKVYEVIRSGESQYLSLLQPELGTSVYVLAAAPVTAADLQAAQPLEDELHATLGRRFQATPAHPTDFAYPEFFFSGSELRPEIGPPFYAATDVQPDRLPASLTDELTAAGFAVESIGAYGGAPLYQVSQGAFVAYLSTVPMGDRPKTLLITWRRLPGPSPS